ncbi:MAG: hypothetical protein HC886_18800 [Leptolyngbyaceae cyanobacterium SM1_1_3]|nr:hypothetical protein [Leptolyngbyaceae cyanobacterium SM1_1_3]
MNNSELAAVQTADEKWTVRKNRRQNQWMVFGGKLVAVVMVANLLLVFFNITYISLRDLYVEYFPVIVHQYDPIKGIELNEITEGYLETVSMLEAAIARDGVFGTKTAAVLKQLQNQSLDMMDDNPFLMADKTAAFARLKRKCASILALSPIERLS